MATVEVMYKSYYTFDIPADVAKYLMTQRQVDDAQMQPDFSLKPTPVGYWWVKYAIFNYIDEEGTECMIHPSAEGEMKWPDELKIEFTDKQKNTE
jgi:hypothetical protein